ncbi:MAG: hypothetical protein IJ946_00180 [Clostridia bacterium]|nr:hypothetical protein [Clostridia bacterium]
MVGWVFENNCTKMISNKSSVEIVIIKGTFSGLGEKPKPQFYVALLIMVVSTFLMVKDTVSSDNK